MKSYHAFLLFVLSIFVCSFTNADTLEIDNVVVALKSGNAAQLSRYFDNRVDITLPERTDNYSRTQAEMILKDFFVSNGVRNFDLKYKSENAGSNYCIGTLQTRTGNYRTTLLMKQKGDRQYLQDLSFQKIE